MPNTPCVGGWVVGHQCGFLALEWMAWGLLSRTLFISFIRGGCGVQIAQLHWAAAVLVEVEAFNLCLEPILPQTLLVSCGAFWTQSTIQHFGRPGALLRLQDLPNACKRAGSTPKQSNDSWELKGRFVAMQTIPNGLFAVSHAECFLVYFPLWMWGYH